MHVIIALVRLLLLLTGMLSLETRSRSRDRSRPHLHGLGLGLVGPGLGLGLVGSGLGLCLGLVGPGLGLARSGLASRPRPRSLQNTALIRNTDRLGLGLQQQLGCNRGTFLYLIHITVLI